MNRRWLFVPVLLAASLGGACSESGDDVSETTPSATPTFEQSRADAEELARTVARAFPGADELEFRLGGQLDCRDGLVYPVWEGVLVTGASVSDDDLDIADAVLTELGFAESEQHEFAAGPYRLWTDDKGDRALSVTANQAENHLWITASGACATPPVADSDAGT